MKILVIIIALKLHYELRPNIIRLKEIMNSDKNVSVDFACISSMNDFSNYSDIIDFKYTMISPKKQMSKLCDFIEENKKYLEYDWYIKTRPDVYLISPISINTLPTDSINSRLRRYIGPKKIPFGGAVCGIGFWSDIADAYKFNNNEGLIEYTDNPEFNMDCHIFIFYKTLIDINAFKPISSKEYESFLKYSGTKENETFLTLLFYSRNIKINPIGIDLYITNDGITRAYSSDINC